MVSFVFYDHAMITRRMQPFGGGCLLFLGTWSHLYILCCPCLLCFGYMFRFIDFETVDSILLSLFYTYDSNDDDNDVDYI